MAMRIFVKRIVVRIFNCIVVPSLFSVAGLAWAEEENSAQTRLCPGTQLPNEHPVLVAAHEANRVGFTKDSGDRLFLDFLISVQHPLVLDSCSDRLSGQWMQYFAFTGRFGEYVGAREASSVIGKRFNPKIFVRYFLDGKTISNHYHPDAYIDFEYAHESNGQTVDSQESFNAAANSTGGSPDFAKDSIKRGWDYLGLAGKQKHAVDDITLGYALRKYLANGLTLQKQIEQYKPWEGERSITKINQVSGIHLYAEKAIGISGFDDIAVDIETGNSQPFRYCTLDIELGVTPFRHFLGMPVVFWVKTGYNSDLAEYYRKVTTVGIALNFNSFIGSPRSVPVENPKWDVSE